MKVVELILNEKWKEGLQEVLKSATTQTIFLTQTVDKQFEIITQWFKARKT